MAGLSGLLSKVIDSSTKGGLKNLLAGAGLTLASNAVFMVIVEQYITHLRAQTGALSADLASLIHLSGGDYALSIILSAVVTRIAINPPKLSMMKR
jgi:membrane protein insertase Oxa1/YidC/SpoIIIJ